jgi:hypothetical protein
MVPATAFLERQARLRAIQGLDLALLVDGKHQRFIGRIEVETDDVLHLIASLATESRLRRQSEAEEDWGNGELCGGP